ncbi:MAG: DUF2085 domain-containing protein [Candidatus Altiarchaeales archaeon]|nr:DUF2085 domain-containing protein [Candidatus Altiarchaeales archaeon]
MNLIFKPFCHQHPERSIGLSGNMFAVCTRCLGIYMGLFIGSTACLFFGEQAAHKQPPLWFLILFASPMMVDGGTQLIGLRESSNHLRIITGTLFGFILPLYLTPALNDVLDKFSGPQALHPRMHS